jgi:ornithine cyclodeaminase/alanine dehydrogenase-like protein (mu-crystallin family)
VALLIDNETARRLLSADEAYTAVREALERESRGAAVNRRGIIHTQLPDEVGGDWHRFRITEGTVEDLGVAVVRINSQVVSFTGRSQNWYAGEPGRFCGLILLYSTHSGVLLGILQDGYIQHQRVGCTSLVGASYLARPDAATMCILGSGGMAHAHATAARVAFPIEEFRVFSPTKENRERFGAELAESSGTKVTVHDDPETAVRGAAMVATCTDSVRPVLEWDWVAPGTHISSVTGPLELGPDLLARFDLYASHHPAINDGLIASAAGDVPLSTAGAPRPGAPHPESTVAAGARRDLLAIIRGEQIGRADASQISGFWASGTATPVAAMALLVYRAAVDAGLGTEMPDDWFLESDRD